MNQPNWEKIRKEFALTKELAYFQSAGLSPIPRSVYKTMREAYKKIYHYGDMYWMQDLQSCQELNGRLQKLIGSEPGNTTFLPNTSSAFSLIALSLKNTFGEDFNLVTMEDEFPASNVPFAYQGIQMKYVKPVDNRYPISQIEQQIDANTRGIVCSYVQYGMGFRHDLEALGRLAKKNNLLFIVNATQGLPVFPVDVEKMNIDVLSASLHKWGCAAHVGALFYTSASFRKAFPVPMAGWLSVLPPSDDFIPTQKGTNFTIHPDAMQYNMGTTNLQSLLGLQAALDFMENIGWENIPQRVLELVNLTISLLKEIPGVEILSPASEPSEQSGILSINIKDKNNQEAVDFLLSRKVVTSIRQKNIRIACNYFNNEDDIRRLIKGIKAFSKLDFSLGSK